MEIFLILLIASGILFGWKSTFKGILSTWVWCLFALVVFVKLMPINAVLGVFATLAVLGIGIYRTFLPVIR